MLDQQTRDDMQAVVNYLYYDEGKDWEHSDEPQDHIFCHVRRLQLFLDPDYKD